MAQLNYPVQNMLDHVFQLWADAVGKSTKLSEILAPDDNDCHMIIGMRRIERWCCADQDFRMRGFSGTDLLI